MIGVTAHIAAIMAFCAGGVRGHGYLLEPLSRNAKEFGTRRFEPSGGNGIDAGVGNAGPCGDPFQAVPDMDFLNRVGTPEATVEAGGLMTVKMDVNINHGGWNEFRLTNKRNGMQQSDFGPPLIIDEHGGTRYWFIDGSRSEESNENPRTYTTKVRIPSDVACEDGCVLQWWWATQNSCRDACPENECGEYSIPGFNPVTGHTNLGDCAGRTFEIFKNCADVMITGGGGGSRAASDGDDTEDMRDSSEDSSVDDNGGDGIDDMEDSSADSTVDDTGDDDIEDIEDSSGDSSVDDNGGDGIDDMEDSSADSTVDDTGDDDIEDIEDSSGEDASGDDEVEDGGAGASGDSGSEEYRCSGSAEDCKRVLEQRAEAARKRAAAIAARGRRMLSDCDSVLGVAAKQDDLQLFSELVKEAGLTGKLNDPSAAYTIFAPSNKAINALSFSPSGRVLKEMVLCHVVKGEVLTGDIVPGRAMDTLGGCKLVAYITNAGKVEVGLEGQVAGTAVAVDHVACKGGVHVMDTVLTEPPFTANALVVEQD